MQANEVKAMIERGLPDAEVNVAGEDGVHFEATVISAAFDGKTMLAQHQMVFATLGDHMQQGTIHALALRTFTPEQWADQNT